MNFQKVCAIFLAVALSGCASMEVPGGIGADSPGNPPTSHADPHRELQQTSPSELSPPIWRVGDAWHYIDPEGRWQNWTVVAIEERRGYETYRVKVEYSTQQLETTDFTCWIDTQTLGTIEQQYVNGVGGYGNPAPLFPLINETYDMNWTLVVGAHRYQENATFEKTVSGWETITVPAGEFDVVEINKHGTNQFHRQSWYSPHVGNLIRDTVYGPFELVSWHRADPAKE